MYRIFRRFFRSSAECSPRIFLGPNTKRYSRSVSNRKRRRCHHVRSGSAVAIYNLSVGVALPTARCRKTCSQ